MADVSNMAQLLKPKIFINPALINCKKNLVCIGNGKASSK